jgi:hypothetical protein
MVCSLKLVHVKADMGCCQQQQQLVQHLLLDANTATVG